MTSLVSLGNFDAVWLTRLACPPQQSVSMKKCFWIGISLGKGQGPPLNSKHTLTQQNTAGVLNILWVLRLCLTWHTSVELSIVTKMMWKCFFYTWEPGSNQQAEELCLFGNLVTTSLVVVKPLINAHWVTLRNNKMQKLAWRITSRIRSWCRMWYFSFLEIVQFNKLYKSMS